MPLPATYIFYYQKKNTLNYYICNNKTNFETNFAAFENNLAAKLIRDLFFSLKNVDECVVDRIILLLQTESS